MTSLPAFDIEAQLPHPPPPPPAIAAGHRPAQPGSARLLEEHDRYLEDIAPHLMVVATLIAGFALAAGLNPPGGVLSEMYFDGEQYIDKGKSVLAVTDRLAYERFFLLQALVVATSLVVLVCVISGLQVNRRIVVLLLRVVTLASLMAMLLLEASAITAFTPFNIHGPDSVMLTLRNSILAMCTLMVAILIGHVIRFLRRGRMRGEGTVA